MPIYKDKVKGTWYVSCYYENWKGETERKMKRGFRTRKEAQEWEYTFKLQKSKDLDMLFKDFVEIYKQDIILSNLGDEYILDNITNKIVNQQNFSMDKTIYSKKDFNIESYFRKYERKELTGFQKLYVYYQFKLGILPKSNQRKPYYSKELRQAMKQLDNISNETILLCNNNIETLEQLNQYKMPLQEQLSLLESKRIQCRNKIRRCPEGTLKEQLKAESKSYTPEINRIRKEIQCCERIKERSLYLQQFEIEIRSRVEKGRTR